MASSSRRTTRRSSRSKNSKEKTPPKQVEQQMKKNKQAEKIKKRSEKKKVQEQEPDKEQEPLNLLSDTVPARREHQHRLCILCDDDHPSKRGQSDADGAAAPEKEYIKCAMKNCLQKMHVDCAENYRCGEYSPSNAKLLFNVDGPVCPAHFCSHCYDERSKNASQFGELIDCKKCVRSFHLQCLPAGAKIISKSGKRKTFVCHAHSGKQKITERMRLIVCVECEEPFTANETTKRDETDGLGKMECKNCSNVYHRKCSYVEVRGLKEEYKNDLCAYCIHGSNIVPGQHVLAYFPSWGQLASGYYPGVATAISDIPPVVATRLGKDLGKCGFIPIRWLNDDNPNPCYNMVHRSLVHRMSLNSVKNLRDDDFKAEVIASMKNFLAPTLPLDNAAMRETISIIDKNVYTKELTPDERHEKPTVREDGFECNCKPVMVNGIFVKCSSDECENRLDNFECPKTCEAEQVKGNGVICANRAIQKKEEKPPKFELRLAGNGKGFGIFATGEIEKRAFITEYCGEVMNKQELDRRQRRTAELRANDEWTYTMGLTTKLFVDARFKGSLARYINHSCKPNAKVETVFVPFKYTNKTTCIFEAHLKVFALEKIQPGEEITFDYELKKTVGLALDSCRCGAENCMGKIGKMGSKDDDPNERFEGEVGDLEEEEDVKEGELDEAKENNKAPKKKKTKTTQKKTAMKRRASSHVATPAPEEKKRK